MKRIILGIDEKAIEKLKAEKEKHGHSTVSGFIRYIIHRFFEDKKQ
jgi:hypothetical protein